MAANRFTSVGWPIVPNHYQRSRMVFLVAAVKRRWRSRQCCFQLSPWLPPPQSPDKLPSSSWPSLPTGDWWSPPKQADLATPICPSGRHRPESGLRPRRRSWPHSLGPPLGFGGTGGRKLSALHPWLSGGVFWVASARSPTGGGSSSNCSDSAPDQSFS